MGSGNSANGSNPGAAQNVLRLAVGLGVGVPCLLVLGIMIWFTYHHRKAARMEDKRHQDIDLEGDITMLGMASPQKFYNRSFDKDVGPDRHKHADRDDSSAYIYTPYVHDDQNSLDDFTRSFHSLVGPSPMYHVHKTRSASSLSSQSRGDHAPRRGSALRGDPADGDASWGFAKHNRRNSGHSIKSRQSYVSESPGKRSSFDNGLGGMGKTSLVHEVHDEADEADETDIHRAQHPDLLDHDRDDDASNTDSKLESERTSEITSELTSDSPAPVVGSPDPKSLNPAGLGWDDKLGQLDREPSRGHAAVLDLYDTYRQKSVKTPNPVLIKEEDSYELGSNAPDASFESGDDSLRKILRHQDSTRLAQGTANSTVLPVPKQRPEDGEFTAPPERPAAAPDMPFTPEAAKVSSRDNYKPTLDPSSRAFLASASSQGSQSLANPRDGSSLAYGKQGSGDSFGGQRRQGDVPPVTRHLFNGMAHLTQPHIQPAQERNTQPVLLDESVFMQRPVKYNKRGLASYSR